LIAIPDHLDEESFKEKACTICSGSVALQDSSRSDDAIRVWCDWVETEEGNKCEFRQEISDSGLVCRKEIIEVLNQCEELGIRKITSRNVKIDGPIGTECESDCGAPGEACTIEEPCARAMVAPVFSVKNFIPALFIITLIYFFFLRKRIFS